MPNKNTKNKLIIAKISASRVLFDVAILITSIQPLFNLFLHKLPDRVKILMLHGILRPYPIILIVAQHFI